MALKGEKPHYRYIDYAKALAMILVILGHIDFANQGIKAWIYAFHMPAFFFVSGMLVKEQTARDVRSFAVALWKKFQGLMFPYFIWALIYTSLEGQNLLKVLYGSHQTLAGAGALTSLWFLPVLFEATALFYLAQLTFRKKLNAPVKLILAAVSFCVAAFLPTFRHGWPWCVNIAFSAFGFMLLGSVLLPWLQKLVQSAAAAGKGIISCAVIAILTFAASFLFLLNIPDNGYINTANAQYGNYLLFLLSAVIGTIFILSASILLDRFLPKGRGDVFAFLGQNTLCAFAVQKPIIKVFKKLFAYISVPDVVALIVTCVGTAILCCLIAAFINRYLPIMNGRLSGKQTTATREETGGQQ